MVLSRQDMPVFNDADAKVSKKNARRGGYVIREDADAVFTLVELARGRSRLDANDRLAEQGVKTRVVALPCWRCFDAQPSDYRNAVLRRALPQCHWKPGRP